MQRSKAAEDTKRESRNKSTDKPLASQSDAPSLASSDHYLLAIHKELGALQAVINNLIIRIGYYSHIAKVHDCAEF